jgi:deoxyribodipyrimidine photo-lyase
MLKFTVFWFRRDLRLNDNVGLFQALKEGKNVLPIFIFDTEILKALKNPNDRRVVFIHRELDLIKTQLNKLGSDLLVLAGEPVSVFQKLIKTYSIEKVYTNRDYEPYARERDKKVSDILVEHGVELLTFKDQVIFEKNDILTDQKKTYSVYTPYKKKWLATIQESDYALRKTESFFENFHASKTKSKMPTLAELGFNNIEFEFPSLSWPTEQMTKYKEQRDIPSIENGTSRFGLHLRFGTVSVRELVKRAIKNSDVWLSELIWREFFMQILWHYPKTQTLSFRPQYENIKWRNDEKEFAAWSTGQTGYPLVDAGIRELLQTGHMHNRVRMVVASFLSKHLLTHWYLGERFFAQHLLDYDLAANNGNWQWAAGTGCDAAPYFRVFNPTTQIEKFDPDYIYIKKWVPEFGTAKYPKPIVEHVFARTRALEEYKKGINK